MRFYQFHDTTREAYIRKSANVNDNVFLRSDGSNLGAFLYMLKNKTPKSYNDILDTIKQIAPYIDELVLEDDYNSSHINLCWKERYQNRYNFNAAQMSDGTLRALALVTLLMQPNIPPVICIDEPELGLHPEGIAILADLIKCASEKSQIIVATQSAALINYFEPQDIIVVNKERGETRFERLEYKKYEAWLSEYSLSEVWETNVFGGRPLH